MIIENFPLEGKDLKKVAQQMGYSVVGVDAMESINRIKHLRKYQLLWAVQENNKECLPTSIRQLYPSELFWLQNVKTFILDHIDDSLLTAEVIAHKHAVSVRHLSRKLKKLTGKNTTEFVREVRLRKALEYLESGTCSTVKSAGFIVGYHDTKYFSKIFRKKYGIAPSQLLKGTADT